MEIIHKCLNGTVREKIKTKKKNEQMSKQPDTTAGSVHSDLSGNLKRNWAMMKIRKP